MIVRQGPANDAVAIGLEARDASALDVVRARLDRAGSATDDGSADDQVTSRSPAWSARRPPGWVSFGPT